ncbi:hypothetical protein ACQKQD_06490 [Methylobacterium sp. NPDC080182]|uniref:hypothetical protein n=1 Tax=Methylobacterium sp. NPDC080182 TaxID=3390590 RepID=UPI003D08EFDD
MPDNDLTDARAEIVMLRARITALETAVKALLAVPCPREVDDAISEMFEIELLGLYGERGDQKNDVTPLKATERAHLHTKIIDATWKLDRSRVNGPSDGWQRFVARQEEGH